jgi:hypothetical protein
MTGLKLLNPQNQPSNPATNGLIGAGPQNQLKPWLNRPDLYMQPIHYNLLKETSCKISTEAQRES